ncbi:phosphoserine aminotransferase [Mycotypha africana]|uniref:phosphoserine aminotransferase n=1 Tax=Mycotypha africana TaxID=64632 RepID=UPI00230012DB|nr:phosphoserine aminotransferase [Mycotypha africana]KAI8967188.1 phosphoserine aminotransferase [Mycotypha africana]
MSNTSNHVLNFGAGPAKIPESVLKKAQKEFLDINGTGMSVMELSHRSKPFGAILQKTKDNLAKLMDIPSDYSILFMQGGATTQFAAIFLNLVAKKQDELIKLGKEKEEIVVDYFVTGAWSNKAVQEAERLAPAVQSNPIRVNRVIDVKQKYGKFGTIPPPSEWNLTDPTKHHVAYVYYCDNETIHGVEFPFVPKVNETVPLVADVSSNFLSRPIHVPKYAVVYGGAQKNLGPAGVTIVVVRNDMLVDVNVGPVRPLMLDFKTAADNNSMYNTPPTFAIYMVGLTLEWLIEEKGGLKGIEQANNSKARKLYELIDQSKLYKSPVDPHCRSHMNVVFRLPTEDLEKEFLAGAEKLHMHQLKGHRSVGGIRASIYNAMPEDDVDRLIEYMIEFEKKHSP